MLISFQWLKQYVNLPDSVTALEVAEKLKLSTVEVENVVSQGRGLSDVVVGEIIEFRKHVNADKLHVAKVDVGEAKPRQVIFGQMVKMEIGFKVPVAKAPTILPGNKEIKVGEIRGELSEGMLCLDQELGLLKEGVSIQFFDKKVKNGTPITSVLNLDDTILEVDNKSLSNRPDLLSHYGIAREVAVLFSREVNEYQVPDIKPGKDIRLAADIKDPLVCPKYTAVAVNNIVVAESPAWLKQRLQAIGERPINNIVDITNYVMFELGQPTHAFDARFLDPSKDKITMVVRHAADKEMFTTLDSKPHELDPLMFVIATKEKPVALGGIMGGENSEIRPDTTTIVFESANFAAATVRKTSQKLGLRTEGSTRWEKSQDPSNALVGLKRLVELTLQICPGAAIASNVVDVGKPRLFTGPLEIPFTFFTQKIGVEIPAKTIVTTLTRLGFGVKEKKNRLSITIPTWRATKDVSIPEDIVEEVVRIYGYENIPASLPTFPITPPEKNYLRELEWQVSDVMVRDLGYTEVQNYSFVSGSQITKIGDSAAQYIELDNPLSKEKPYLRRCLLLNLLENLDSNQADYNTLKFFEIGKVYRAEQAGFRAEPNGDELLPGQDVWLTSVYKNKKDSTPFWQAKAVVEMLAKRLRVELECALPTEQKIGRHPARAAEIVCKGQLVGSVYELHPAVSEAFGLEGRVGVVKLNLSNLVTLIGQNDAVVYQPLAPYPVVTRDIAILVNKDVAHASILAALGKADPLIAKVELFDVYEGATVGEGYKSLAYHLTYLSPNRTLTTEEVDKVEQKVEKLLKDRFGAEVRK